MYKGGAAALVIEKSLNGSFLQNLLTMEMTIDMPMLACLACGNNITAFCTK